MKHPIDCELSDDGKLVACYVSLFPRARSKESKILCDLGGMVVGDFDRTGRLIGVEILGPGSPSVMEDK